MIDSNGVRSPVVRPRSIAAVCCLAIAAAMCGCGAPDLFESGGPVEVGATQFAVTSVTRWADIEHDLQPSFQISEEQSLQEVMPVALYSSESQINESRLDLSGSGSLDPLLAGRDRKPAVARKQATAGKTGAATQPTQTRAKGKSAATVGAAQDEAASQDSAGNAAGSEVVNNAGTAATRANPASFLTGGVGGARSPGSITQIQISGRPIDIEPQLKYTLATALMQYVRMTNHYVHDLVNSEGADAFVIRVQVTLMPLSRTAQYDTYTDIGFFVESAATENTSLQVVPLLATDSLEGLMRSNSSSDLKEIAVNLQALVASGSAGIDAEKLTQTLRAVSGQDMNSLLTMGRVSDNTVRVRLGAFAQPTGDYVMVPRTCTVPVVMLVKRQEGTPGVVRVRAVSKTVFVNAKTGKLLRKRTNMKETLQLPSIRDAYWLLQWPYKFDDQAIFDLTEMAETGDHARFSQTIRAANSHADDNQIGRLWLEALSLRATDPVQSMLFALPRIDPSQLPPRDQTATLFDDGVTTTVALRAGSSLTQRALQGVLEVSSGSSTSTTAPTTVPTTAESAMRLYAIDEPAFSANGKSIVFLFPSLTASGVSAPARSTPANVTLCVTSLTSPPKNNAAPDEAAAHAEETRYHVVSLSAEIGPGQEPAPPAPPAPVDVPVTLDVAGQEIIVAQTGDADISLTIDAPNGASPYYLSVEGATATNLDTQGVLDLAPDGRRFVIHKGGPAKLKLSGCKPPLRFHVADDRGHEKIFSFPQKPAQPATPSGQGSQGGATGSSNQSSPKKSNPAPRSEQP